jgi:tRNA-binding protein
METVLDNVTDGLTDAGELVMDAVLGSEDGSGGGRLRRAVFGLLLIGAIIGIVPGASHRHARTVRQPPRPDRSAVAQHQIDPEARPYDPAKLPRKRDVDGPTFFGVDMRAGVVVAVEPFPEARKPAWKIEVDFGPVVGRLQSSAQITNYSAEELLGRTVVGAINLGERRIAGFRSQFLVLARARRGRERAQSPGAA